jgi:hypothetical protein
VLYIITLNNNYFDGGTSQSGISLPSQFWQGAILNVENMVLTISQAPRAMT